MSDLNVTKKLLQDSIETSKYLILTWRTELLTLEKLERQAALARERVKKLEGLLDKAKPKPKPGTTHNIDFTNMPSVTFVETMARVIDDASESLFTVDELISTTDFANLAALGALATQLLAREREAIEDAEVEPLPRSRTPNPEPEPSRLSRLSKLYNLLQFAYDRALDGQQMCDPRNGTLQGNEVEKAFRQLLESIEEMAAEVNADISVV